MALNFLGGNAPSIVNPLPFGLQPQPGVFSSQFSLTDIAYDYAVAGIPFLAGESLRGTYFRRQYLREFSPIRKDQFDNQQVPGEQSISGWWLRSQGNFQDGAGIQYLDTTLDSTLGLRYNYSEGLDTLGTPGQTTLLPATKVLASGFTGPLQVRGVVISGNDNALVLDVGARTLNVYAANGAVTGYAMPGGLTGLANTFTDDGTNYYFADKTGIFKGVIGSISAAVKIWNVPSTSGNYVLGWVKGRLVAALDNGVYELVGTGPGLTTVKFTHQNPSYVFTSISEIPTAILVAGKAGTISQVHKFTLDNLGALPTLSSGVVTTTMPTGEVINTMFAYIGTFVGIGTNKGFRVATTDTNANLVYGPLIVQDPTSVGVLAVAGYDRFLFIGNQGNKLIPQQGWTNPADASAVDMLVRVDLSQVNTTGSQAYANDLMTTGLDGSINSIANFGGSTTSVGMMVFCTQTKVWLTDTANKQPSGFLYTGKIRYNTLEPKHFDFLFLRNQKITDGSMAILATNSKGAPLTSLVSGVQGFLSDDQPISFGNMGIQMEWVQLKFVLNRGTLSTNYSPIWNGYQIRALPGVQRQILMTLPLICHDHEKDKYGNVTGYDGFAFQRLSALEAASASGTIILVQDLNYGTAVQAVVENYRFEQQANEQPKASSGVAQDSNARSGYIILQVRVVQ